MAQARQSLLKLLWFYLGLAVVVLGYSMVIKPGLGAAPWDIFHLGVGLHLPVPLSLIIQGTGAGIILLNLWLGIRPTVGMVLNMLSVGPMMQTYLAVLPVPEAPAGRWAMLVAGVLVAGLGTALYVSAGIGSGPRDGMMIGLTRKLNQPVGVVKNAMDIAVALLGWWLGGPLGLGTILVAVGLGPAVQLGMKLVERLAGVSLFAGFVQPVMLKRS